MTASPDHEARVRAIGNAAVEIIEAVRLIGNAHGLSPDDAVTALTLAARSIGEAADLVATLKEMAGHGPRNPFGRD